MLEDLGSHKDIARLTDRLLTRADAYGVLPTPVGELVVAAGLTEASESFLDDAAQAAAPVHLRGILRRLRGKVHAALDRREREVHITAAMTRARREPSSAFTKPHTRSSRGSTSSMV